MAVCFSSSRPRQLLSKNQNSCVILVVGLCCFFGALLLYFGVEDLYKLQTLVVRHCQVRSLSVKYARHSFFPCWNITVIDGQHRSDDFLIESTGTRSDRWAWIKARRNQVNETYPCYHSRNETSVIQWGWQWNRPTKLKAYTSLVAGVTLFSIAIAVLVLRRRFQTNTKMVLRQQDPQQLQPLFNSEASPTEAKVTSPSRDVETKF